MASSFSFSNVHFAKKKGILLTLSSPSGVGKSSLARLLVKETKAMHSISVTTRRPRGEEKDGQHYHFFTVEKFHQLKEKGAFLEWAKVHNNYYGTLKESVEDALENGQDILFDIDFQGVQQIKQHFPEALVSIFILPPSMEELKKRLEKRAEDSLETIETRLKNAALEISHYDLYDYVLINEDLKQCFCKIKTIYHAERLKRVRHPELQNFVDHLCQQASN